MELKELMKEAGIVGAGGAGFPAYAKLAPGADILLVNGAECEPLLYTDYIILSREMPMVLAGIKAVLEYADIPRALLCVKEHTAKRLNLKDGEKLADRISLKTLPDVYPMGDEISLIYQATGRIVKPGNLPITAGVIVYNAETLYNVAAAVKFSAKVTMKWLTIGGNIPEAIVVRVPVGTPVSELFAGYSITVPEEHAVLDGGPSMGKIRSRKGGCDKDDQGAPDFARSLGGGAVQAPRRGQIGGAGGDGVLSMHPLYGHVSAGASGISAGAAQNGAHGETGGGNFPRDGAFGKPLLRLRRLREPRLLSGHFPQGGHRAL